MIATVLLMLTAMAPGATEVPTGVYDPRNTPEARMERNKAFAADCEKRKGIAVVSIDAEDGTVLTCVLYIPAHPKEK